MHAYVLCQLIQRVTLTRIWVVIAIVDLWDSFPLSIFLSLIFSLLCFDTGDSDGGVTFILNFAPFIWEGVSKTLLYDLKLLKINIDERIVLKTWFNVFHTTTRIHLTRPQAVFNPIYFLYSRCHRPRITTNTLNTTHSHAHSL